MSECKEGYRYQRLLNVIAHNPAVKVRASMGFLSPVLLWVLASVVNLSPEFTPEGVSLLVHYSLSKAESFFQYHVQS